MVGQPAEGRNFSFEGCYCAGCYHVSGKGMGIGIAVRVCVESKITGTSLCVSACVRVCVQLCMHACMHAYVPVCLCVRVKPEAVKESRSGLTESVI